MSQPQFNQRQKDISRLMREQQAQRGAKGAHLKSMKPFKLQAAFMKKGGR